MVTEELLRYVEYQANRGVDRNSIKMTLLQNGWTGDDINEAFKVVDTVSGTATPVVFDTQSAQAADTFDGLNESANPATVDDDKSSALAGKVDQYQRPSINQVENNGSDNVSYETSARIAETNVVENTSTVDSSRPNTSESLKYRTASDWQRPGVSLLELNGNPGQQSHTVMSQDPQQLQRDQGPQALQDKQLSQVQNSRPNLVQNQQLQSNQSQPVSTLDPKPVANNNDSAQMNVINNSLAGVYRPQVSSTGIISNVGPQVIRSNPSQTLAESKRNQAKNTKKSGILFFFIGLVSVIAIAAAGYWYYENNLAKPTYTVSDVLSAMKSQDYVKYDVNGILPIDIAEIDSESPVALQQLTSEDLQIKMEGLLEPATQKTGFRLGLGEATFDYVYDGQLSYGLIKTLPQSLQELYKDSLDQWFSFDSQTQTQSVLQFFSKEPAESLPTLGGDLSQAFAALNDAGLLDVVFQDSESSSSGRVDNFLVSFDPAVLSSRLSPTSSSLTELIALTGINKVDSVVKINSQTLLPISMDVTLLTLSGNSQTLSIEFDYTYEGKEITAPPSPLPVETVLMPFSNLSTEISVAQIKSDVKVIASQASVFFEKNDSFSDFCQSESVTALTTKLQASYQVTVQCNSSNDTFALQATLPNTNEYFICVDGTYVDKFTSSALVGNTCAETVQYRPNTITNQTEVVAGQEA